MRILFLGDVVGHAGRAAIRQFLPRVREEFAPDVILANAENVAGGIGMTACTVDELLGAGVDFLSWVNNVWRH